ncbi:MAG: isoleucine--tRNA ligase [Defluviitaleaceae bacterium]|nr:isoleucine--tRNA ligase [Defluviitaleaceae bacterium]MCL2275801.1 isoleucine--tRNA ligase [Defluviitaleaceae bacterium]
MYTKVPTSLNFAERELGVLQLWKTQDIFNKSLKAREGREGAEAFTFYDGPPTANGRPHIAHVITRAIKDLIPRYQTMKGKRVLRKAGWDTHGLPVELEIEKKLGISGKPEIEKYGIEPFIQQCKESVWTYKTLWEEMSRRVGYWIDMDTPYVTYENDYIESVWWALSEIFKKDLIYKSYRVVPYCPRCGTPLSSHEVAQGYKDVKEASIFVGFKVAGKDELLLAWTTTPWTLPSNVGLCVNANEDYVRATLDGKTYILAAALAEQVLSEGYTIEETLKGRALEGLKYEPLFDFAPDAATNANYCTVVCDDYVTLTDGSGIVHIAPAFGEDDARISKAYDLPLIQLVDAQGCFTEAAHLFAGQFVKDADKNIIRELKQRGQMFKRLEYLHSYPFCWRCDTPLIYYARDAWFIRMSDMRKQLMQSNAEVNWLPAHMKDGRFGNFIENVIDWSVSRERYWGTPLPIWLCDSEECGHRECIGSIADLRAKGKMKDGSPVPMDIELHKPYVDNIVLACEKCGGDMFRTPEVIDCWFDSGAMFFAQWHYPFENKEMFDDQFPADFISEAVDQTRGWFYTLMAISTLLFEKSSYKNVIVLGLGLDETGKKMSKSKGNAVSPMDALTKHGADAVRWFMYAVSPGNNFRYSDDIVQEAQRKFMGTLWNTYAFYVLYAEIDRFNPHSTDNKSLLIGLPAMDRWIISRLHTLIAQVDALMARYELTEATRVLEQFVDELSNWYLRRSRERFWASGMEQDKINAYRVLHMILVEVAKLAAPFVPFMTELMYQNLVYNLDKTAPESVHLCDYPVSNPALINAELEQEMARVLDIVQLGRSARNAGNIKTRQPLPEMLVALPYGTPIIDSAYQNIVKDELNVKSLRFVDDAEGYTSVKIKPNLRTLGPRYGKLVPKITQALNEDASAILSALKAGAWNTSIDGTEFSLVIDDVLVESLQKEGYSAASDKGITVVLDTTLTPELIEEGNVRELVSKWQTMRRDAGFEVTDNIRAGYSDNTILSEIIARNADYIAEELLASKLENTSPPSDAFSKEWNINGTDITLWVLRV